MLAIFVKPTNSPFIRQLIVCTINDEPSNVKGITVILCIQSLIFLVSTPAF